MKENLKENIDKQSGIGPYGTGRRGLEVTFPEKREFAGHSFVHLAGGLYKAEEEFELKNAEARKLLREYRGVRLYVRKREGQTGRYSDYYSNYSVEVARYPVYQVLYAYEAEYANPELDYYLEDDNCFKKRNRWFLKEEYSKLNECRKKRKAGTSEIDLLSYEAFLRNDLKKKKPGSAKEEVLPENRTAFEWSWPEEGIPGYVRFGDVVCEEIEDGIYKPVAYFSLGKYWDYYSAVLSDISFPEGVNVDDIAYTCEYDMFGGWGIPQEHLAVNIAIGEEHFERLRKLDSMILYHPDSKKHRTK